MSALAVEREHLVKANIDIVGGEHRILAQARLIERLRRDGQKTAEADLLLVNLEQTLVVWNAHREQILLTITRLEQIPI